MTEWSPELRRGTSQQKYIMLLLRYSASFLFFPLQHALTNNKSGVLYLNIGVYGTYNYLNK